MSEALFKRKHLRSPLTTIALYQSDRYVFKAYCLNISEGGVLLENLPSVPEVNAIPLLLSIPQFPEFSSLSAERIAEIGIDELKTKNIRVKARTVRQFEGLSAVDQIFVTRIGCEFVHLNDEAIETIKKYVSIFAKNTIYLLNLFESHGNSEQKKKHLRYVSSLLGYDPDQKLSLLRQKVLHDYQSLESL
ncbi:PilZ domain-containing protein [Halobacteriovorax sp. HLS]|uniref:PilZ domain-containing protein n=1 Tax=Halobacteriovorax sp. HLS TaxID=2234000 RepID=UPI000FD70DB8|nr:PilZ domain-containing protein [Halobacteriovorax sp. HLS]